MRGLYSDVLHAPYFAAHFRGRGLKPAWLQRDNCPRLHRPSLEEFRRACEEPNLWVFWFDLFGGEGLYRRPHTTQVLHTPHTPHPTPHTPQGRAC